MSVMLNRCFGCPVCLEPLRGPMENLVSASGVPIEATFHRAATIDELLEPGWEERVR